MRDNNQAIKFWDYKISRVDNKNTKKDSFSKKIEEEMMDEINQVKNNGNANDLSSKSLFRNN